MVKNIKEFHQLLIEKKITVTSLVSEYLENIKNKNTEINAVLEVFDDAQDFAKKCDQELEGKSEDEIKNILSTKQLFGVPMIFKDNIILLLSQIYF